MDITNNVSLNKNNNEEENNEKNEKNKNKDGEEAEAEAEADDEDDDENEDEDEDDNKESKNNIKRSLSSSDYEKNLSEMTSTENTLLSETLINDVLEGNDTNINYKNFDINDLNKNATFNKLTNNQKTLVINRILEKVPKNMKIIKSSNINKESYNYCKTCGYYKKIKNKTSIFTRGNEKKNYSYNLKLSQYKHDFTLPCTKKYNCINESCNTHKNPKNKYALFMRDSEYSYNIKYICIICDSSWNTFIEK